MKCEKKTRFERIGDEVYELVPPEGGWGYMVCIGLSAIFISCTAHQPVFGFIYNDFLISLGVGSQVVATVFGIFAFMAAIGGFSANLMLKKLSLRQVGIVGSVTYTTGTFIGIFVTTTWQLYLTNGFLQGFGFGLMIPVSYTSFNSYFTLKKVLYLSLCKAGIGLVMMFYPSVMKYTMEVYGFRGTLAIICAFGAHSIFGVLVMEPVEYHLVRKKAELTADEERLLSVSVESHKNIQIQMQAESNLLKGDLISNSLPNMKRQLDANGHKRLYMDGMYRPVSLHSLGNYEKTSVEDESLSKSEASKWMRIVQFLDLHLFKDLVYSNICFGMALSFFADITFFALEPLMLYKLNFSLKEISNIITVGGATDMAARLSLAMAGQFFKMHARYMFLAGSLLTAFMRIVFTQFEDYMVILVLTGIIGALRSLLHVPMAIIMADHVPIERYPSAYGLFMLVQGLVNLTVGPLIGIARDITGSYPIAFHMLTLCNLLCAVPWSLEELIKRTKCNKLTDKT